MTHPTPIEASNPRDGWRAGWVWDLFVIASFTAFGPAMAYVNSPESPLIWTPMLLAAGLVLMGFGARLALLRFGFDGRGSTYAIAVFSFGVLNLGGLTPMFPLGRLGIVGVCLLASALVHRLRRLKPAEFVISWACLALAIAPIATGIAGSDTGFRHDITIRDIDPIPLFPARPDVVVVVADGYAGDEVLSDLYDYDNRSFTTALAAVGTETLSGIQSNYARTKLSIPSLLEMGYIPVGTAISGDVEEQLLDVIGGDNLIADIMRENGYRTVYLESGWSGTRCAQSVDVCIHNVWPDEPFYDIVHRSILRDLPGLETGMSFARGAKHTLDVIQPTLETYLTDNEPDFIYVHLLAPHPPLFLDTSCALDPDLDLSGFAVGFPDMTEENRDTRRRAYVGQVECVNSRLVAAADLIDRTGGVGLFLGDHGSDLGHQLFSNADEWTDSDKSERFSIMAAVHHPDCDYSTAATLVNVGRRMVSCLAGVGLPLLSDRFFDIDKRGSVPTVIELSPPSTSF